MVCPLLYIQDKSVKYTTDIIIIDNLKRVSTGSLTITASGYNMTIM